MKYALVIPDGCADEPQESLGGKTPLEAACIPAMNSIAKQGVVGRASNVPDHLPAGSAVANLSLLGYDPCEYFTGRAPLEAAAQGIELGPEDWAIRCNLVTVEDQQMRNFTADHISTHEATELLKTLQESVAIPNLEFVTGVSYRNLLLYRGEAPFTVDTRTTPPHDLTDKSVLEDYPRGPGSDFLNDLMGQSTEWFSDHPVNRARRTAGKLPATSVWLWGQGRAPDLPSFDDLHHKSGVMITAVDLLRGIAALIGWPRIEVPGATGYTDTDYAAKGRHAIAALQEYDFVCVHVEATDEASHEGDSDAKIKALERIDEDIVRPLYEALRSSGEFRICVSPDHPTPVRTKTHSHGDVPFTFCGTDVEPDKQTSYNEVTAAASPVRFAKGHELMGQFLKSHNKR